jgi:pimeloyl-ACP methyl ester carboxylesterase
LPWKNKKGDFEMSNVATNGIRIEYETFGNPSSRPLLLVCGLGNHMIVWDDDLCRDLAARGHYVIRFDNRDAGLSTKFDEAGVPNILDAFAKIMRGEKINTPYSLDDMADDAAGLLDALAIRKAHLCGMSMGGAIAQTIAIRHPSRAQSLISIYSSTGNPELPLPKPEAMKILSTRPPDEKEAYVKHMVDVFKTITGSRFPVDEEWTRRIMTECYDRSFCPGGVGRQLIAILAHGNRRQALARIDVPTLVIHGTQDPLMPVEGGKDTAKAIKGAHLILIEGMGHDIPHGGAWPRIVEEISAHTLRASQ